MRLIILNLKLRVFDLNIIRCIANNTLVCTVVVNGLNDFAVGFLTALPAEGERVNTDTYTVCGTWNDVVSTGLEIPVPCDASTLTSKWRYVIVQSLDTEAEQLCIADVCVKEGGQSVSNQV